MPLVSTGGVKRVPTGCRHVPTRAVSSRGVQLIRQEVCQRRAKPSGLYRPANGDHL